MSSLSDALGTIYWIWQEVGPQLYVCTVMVPSIDNSEGKPVSISFQYAVLPSHSSIKKAGVDLCASHVQETNPEWKSLIGQSDGVHGVQEYWRVFQPELLSILENKYEYEARFTMEEGQGEKSMAYFKKFVGEGIEFAPPDTGNADEFDTTLLGAIRDALQVPSAIDRLLSVVPNEQPSHLSNKNADEFDTKLWGAIRDALQVPSAIDRLLSVVPNEEPSHGSNNGASSCVTPPLATSDIIIHLLWSIDLLSRVTPNEEPSHRSDNGTSSCVTPPLATSDIIIPLLPSMMENEF